MLDQLWDVFVVDDPIVLTLGTGHEELGASRVIEPSGIDTGRNALRTKVFEMCFELGLAVVTRERIRSL